MTIALNNFGILIYNMYFPNDISFADHVAGMTLIDCSRAQL